MFDNRRSARYPTLARALVPEIFEGEALLKDLSITGCCVEYTMFVDIKPNTQCKLQILPDSAAKIAPFELQVESRWVRSGGYSCEIGFTITVSPKGRDFQRYVDYLAWRSTSI
ncbi:PilZ domain-containing protein [Treponema primitia]|uniref:PilZ domain-containing protein n=1 Tax=Treponema primitia TaxID=88058 RepID=UPI000C1F98B8|nr:PilZ domain-containing protein [Treponema primitia]